MPVRKIPKNYLVVTGAYASSKADRLIEFESLLEKEYMLLLDFDNTVDHYEEQAYRIPVPGVRQGYVVDLLIIFKSPDRPTQLVEVKPQEYLDRYADEYALKFASAETFCKQRGWEFVKKTEKDIRIPRLENLKFLRAYRQITPIPEQRHTILNAMKLLGRVSTSEILLTHLGKPSREIWLPIIWHMVLTGELIANLDTVMPVDVPISLPEKTP